MFCFFFVFCICYLLGCVCCIDVGLVVECVKEVLEQYYKLVFVIVVDMFWFVVWYNVGFQDYIDYDFVMLNKVECEMYMIYLVFNQFLQRYDYLDYCWIFQDKVEFDKQFFWFL